jgi:hypothetical protein
MVAAIIASTPPEQSERCLLDLFSRGNMRLMLDKSYCDRMLPFQSQPKYNGDGKTRLFAENLPPVTFRDFVGVGCALSVSTYNLTTRRTDVWTTHLAHKSAGDVTIREAIDASSAAPTYFPPVSLKGHLHIDGGMASADPSLTALAEAMRLHPAMHPPNIKILSVSTGNDDEPISWGARFWGAFRWAFPLLDVLTSAPKQLTGRNASIILGAKNYMRVDIALGPKVDIDDTSDSTYSMLLQKGDEMWQTHGERTLRFLLDE